MITLDPLISKTYNELLEDDERQVELSSKLSIFLLKKYDEMIEVRKQIKRIFFEQNFDGRFCETNSTVLAFAYILANYIQKIDLETYLSQFNFERQIELNEVKDQDVLFDKIFNIKIEDNKDRYILSDIVSDLYYNTYPQSAPLLNKILNSNGLKYDKNTKQLLIDVNFSVFKNNLKQVNLDNANLKKVLLRCDYITDATEVFSQERIQFGSSRAGGLKHSVKNIIIVDLDQVFKSDEELAKESKKEKDTIDLLFSKGESKNKTTTFQMNNDKKDENEITKFEKDLIELENLF